MLESSGYKNQCLRKAPPSVAVHQKIINEESRSPERRRGSDAEIALFGGHPGLEADQNGGRGTARLREKRDSAVGFVEVINADLHAVITPEMSVRFTQQLALLNTAW